MPLETTTAGPTRAGIRSDAAALPSACPVCSRSLVLAGSILFQGDRLVHALCWRPVPREGDVRVGDPAGDRAEL